MHTAMQERIKNIWMQHHSTASKRDEKEPLHIIEHGVAHRRTRRVCTVWLRRTATLRRR